MNDSLSKKYNSLLFLHISDIHFHKGGGDIWDPDKDLRNQLERDVGSFVNDEKAVTAILVSGDIAFSGQSSEYEQAREWLLKLSSITNCNQILVVPGNHDIDQTRSIESKDYTLASYHKQLRGCEHSEDVDELLKHLFHDPTAREKLFLPLTNYNSFAKEFSCDINYEQPFWEREIPLSDGIKIRVRGLNSVLVSNKEDNNRDKRMVVGSYQSLPLEEDNIVYITLCHHPPDWLIDQESTHANLVSRVQLQLFGHKHNQRVERIDNSLRLIAGAAHPSRSERQWIPRYNFTYCKYFVR